jgi:CubicO group peptidase (beta-lactamase class C family)
MFLVMAPFSVTAQGEAIRMERAAKQIDELVRREMNEDHTPGIAVAITSREGLLRILTYGFANRDSRQPVTEETLFGIGSIGKSFTAIATLELHDQGLLDFHTPIESYLPWFTVKSTTPITAHHLLTHTAGLPNMRMELRSSLFQAFWLRQAPAVFDPGKQYHYSSAGFDILSNLIEALAHQPYGDFIQKRIFDPLEMDASEPVFKNKIRLRLATSYEPLFDDRPADPDGPLMVSNWYEYGGGAGSIASTAGNMASYLRMLLNRGSGPHQRIISEQSFQLLTQHAVARGADRYYGYGLEVTEADGHTLIGHGGGVQGFRSAMLGDLNDGIGVIVLANGPMRPDLAQFALNAVRAALRGDALPPLPNADPPDQVLNAAEYAGTYSAPDGKTLVFVGDQGRLLLVHQGQKIALRKKGASVFFCPHPDFSLFLLRFGRDDKGVVTEASYGPQWYANERYTGARQFSYPPEWDAYPGHYRTSTREHVNFRIILRKGRLWIVAAGGDENPLVPSANGIFRVGDSPEWVSFGDNLNGRALRVNYSGTDYARDFTP